MKAATAAGKLILMHDGISIHAAREGGDRAGEDPAYTLISFQSTPPVKAATRGCRPSRKLDSISIHAAREGGDDIARECT